MAAEIKMAVYFSAVSLVLLTSLQLASTRLVEVPDNCVEQCSDQCTCEVGQKWLSYDCSIQFRCGKNNKVKKRQYSCASGKQCTAVGWNGECVTTVTTVPTVPTSSDRGYIHHTRKECPHNYLKVGNKVTLEECLGFCDTTFACVAVQYNPGRKRCFPRLTCDFDNLEDASKASNIYQKKNIGIYIYKCMKGLDFPGNDIECLADVPPIECQQRCQNNTNCGAYLTIHDKGCCLKSFCDVTRLVNNPDTDICIRRKYECVKGLDCVGNDLEYLTSVTPDNCQQRCKDNASCVAYLTNPDERCRLKSLCDVTSLTKNSDTTTCIGTCNAGPFGGSGGVSYSDANKVMDGIITGFAVITHEESLRDVIHCFGFARSDGSAYCFGEQRGKYGNQITFAAGEYITGVDGRSSELINQLYIRTNVASYGPYGANSTSNIGEPFSTNFKGPLQYITGRSGAAVDQVTFHYFC